MQALSFLTCKEKIRVDGCSGKGPQREHASIRHMHGKHSAYTNPTSALRAPLLSHIFHFSFDLCRAKEVNARTPNKRSSDNPSVSTKLTTRTQCMRVT